jgi:hypothetical protein
MPYKDKNKKKEHDSKYSREYYPEWYRKNKTEKLNDIKKRFREQRKQVIELLGGKCVRCGFSDWRVLQVNHKNGGGSKERRMKGTHGIFREILSGKRSTDDLDLRCANCNILYQYEK